MSAARACGVVARATAPDALVALRGGEIPAPAKPLDVGALYLWHEGRIEWLARAGSGRAALYRIADEYGARVGYPAPVLTETNGWLRRPGFDDPALDDLTHLPFVTIDNDGSRDLDQALFVERSGAGWVIRYALADASYYVRPGSALFTEALARGVTYYLPSLALPMLPRALSEGLVSLNPEVVRRAVVIHMHVDGSGRCTGSEITRARIRSRAQLTYDGVQAYFDDPAASPLANQPFTEVLDAFREVGERRIEDAQRRDVVAYQRTQVTIRLPSDGGMAFELLGDVRNATERYNEQVSLMCNMEAARLLRGSGIPAIWRVHPAPPEPRLDALAELVGGAADLHGLPWRWRPQHRGGTTVSDLLTQIRASGPRILQQVAERYAMISNVRSEFTDTFGPHHGVGADGYVRFSSPMREIVGVQTHAALLRACGYASWRLPDEQLGAVIAAGNDGQMRQRQLTKEANRTVLDAFFAPDLECALDDRRWLRGCVVELRPTRIYVRLSDIPLEVKVYAADLGNSPRLTYGGAAMALRDAPVSQIALGQPLHLRVKELRRDQWRFDLRTRDDDPGLC